MSPLNAAATLSLEINTGNAETKLQELETRFAALQGVLSQEMGANGLVNLGPKVQELTRQLASQSALIEQLKKGHEAMGVAAGNSTDKLTKSLNGVQASAGVAGAAIEGAKNKASLFAAEVDKMATKGTDFSRLVKGLTLTEMAADTSAAGIARFLKVGERIKSVMDLSGGSTEHVLERWGIGADKVTGALEGSNLAYLHLIATQEREIKVAGMLAEQNKILASSDAAQAAAVQAGADAHMTRITERAAQEYAAQVKFGDEYNALLAKQAKDAAAQLLRDNEKKLALERQYILNSERQRLQHAIDARKLMDRNHPGNMQVEFAPQVLATASGSTLTALEAQMKALSPAAAAATVHQQKWNATASESHALARGLSGSLGQLWMTYGQLAPLMAGAALGAGFKGAMQKGAEFEYQLTFVKALGGESAEAVSHLSDAALKLGTTGLKGPVELASGLRILAQAGLDAADAALALPHALNLATTGEMSMEQAAMTLVGVMHAFKLEVSDIGHIGDVFAKAAALSQTSVVGMTDAMKTASVVGTQYGVSMEDAATALTLLAKVNIHGTAAGTSLRNMLKELYTPAAGSAKLMKELGLSASDASGKLKPMASVIYELKGKLGEFDKVSQVNILQKLFGERGAKEAIAMLSLTEEKWTELRDTIAGASGFMANVTAQLEMTAKGMFAQAKGQLEADLIEAFQATDGAAKKLATSLKDVFASESFKSDIKLMVEALSGLGQAVLFMLPALIRLGEAWVVFKGLSYVAAGAHLLYGALVGLPAAITIVGGTAGVTTGLLAGLRAGLAATTTSAAVAAGATGLGSFAAVLGVLTAPLTLVIAGIGALYWGYTKLQYAVPDSVKGTEAMIDASKRYTEKLREEIKELQKKQRLLATGSESDVDAKKSAMQSATAALAKMQADLAKHDDETGRAHTSDSLINTLKRSSIEAAIDKQHDLIQMQGAAFRKAERTEKDKNIDALKTFAMQQEHALNVIDEQAKIARQARAKDLKKPEITTDTGEARAAIKKLADEGNTLRYAELEARQAEVRQKVEDARASLMGAGKKHMDLNAEKPYEASLDNTKQALNKLQTAYAEYEGNMKVLAEEGNISTKQALAKKLVFLEQTLAEELAIIKKAKDAVAVKPKLKDADKTRYGEKLETQETEVIKKATSQRAAINLAIVKDAEHTAHLLEHAELMGGRKQIDVLAQAGEEYDLKFGEHMAKLKKQVAGDGEYWSQESTDAAAELKRYEAARKGFIDIQKQDRETPKIQAKNKEERDQLFEKRDQSVMLTRDKLALDASTAAESKYNEELAKNKALLQEAQAASTPALETVKMYEARIRAITAARIEDGVAAKQLALDLYDYHNTLTYGLLTGVTSYQNSIGTMATGISSTVQRAFKGMEDALVTFVKKGKLDFRSLATSMIDDMIRIQIQQSITGPLAKMAGGFLKSLLPGGDAMPEQLSGPDMPNANGNVFQSADLHGYANTVVSSPTLFKFASGGSFNRGLMGEVGPEAIMPLKRTASGRLGVEASGMGGGGGDSFSISISVDASGNSNQSGDGGNKGAELGRQIEAAVRTVILKEKRPNGLLAGA